jgi:hypothetical protein
MTFERNAIPMGEPIRVAELLGRCGTTGAVMPPTQLYNEGWMLRLVLDWFAGAPASAHELTIARGGRWYSEALLPSTFFATKRGDPRAEGWTNADAVIGHFQLCSGGRGDIELTPEARQLVIVEAKLGSGLSTGVKNAPSFNQAARSVACLCHLVERSKQAITNDWRLGFYVLAPQSKIEDGVFEQFLDLEGPSGIKAVVEARVATFAPDLDRWHADHFLKVLSNIKIRALSWESVLAHIRAVDAVRGNELAEFYQLCLIHNRALPPSAATSFR